MFGSIVKPIKTGVNSVLNSLIGFQTARAVSGYREYPSAKTALLLVDTQIAFFDDDSQLIDQYSELINYARTNEYLIVFSTSSSQAGTPYPTPARLIAIEKLKARLNSAEIPTVIAASSTERVFDNRTRLSAFSDTNLGQHLENQGAEHLVIAGPLTNTTLDSTVRDAAQRDLHVTVIDGLYRKSNAEESKAELENTLSRYAHHIMSVEKFKTYSD